MSPSARAAARVTVLALACAVGLAALCALSVLSGCVSVRKSLAPPDAPMPSPEAITVKGRDGNPAEYLGEVRAGGPGSTAPKGSYPVAGLYGTYVPEGLLGYEYAEGDRRFVLYPCRLERWAVTDAATIVSPGLDVWPPGWHVVYDSVQGVPAGISQ